MHRTTLQRGAAIAACCFMHTLLFAQSDLKTTIEDLEPAYYWPLEDSFKSGVQTQGAVTFTALGDAPAPTGGMATQSEYFPLLPPHMTVVPASTALIFGETTGELAGAERYLRATSSDFDPLTPVDPLVALGMSGTSAWTLHVMVSPEPDSVAGNYDTVFDVGSSSNGVRLEVDRRTSATSFKLTRTVGGTSSSVTVLVDDADAHSANGRKWYQVVACYHTATNPLRLALWANDEDDAVASNGTTTSTTGDASVGITNLDMAKFDGALHHLAIWKSDMFSSISTLETAYSVEPDERPALTIDWNAEPRYYTFVVPTNVGTFSGRDLTNWKDDFWDRPNVYPMVRFQAAFPDDDGVQYTPPGYDEADGKDPDDCAFQAANWIEYVNDMLVAECSDTVSKSLDDGYSLYFQNWGSENDNATQEYTDRGAVRALARNWRDVPSYWRDGTNDLTYGNPDKGELAEINVPFYREGMSLNAFRTREIFEYLSDELASRGNLPAPTRMHCDFEHKTTGGWAVPSDDQSPLDTEGWWFAARADGRADDPALWLSGTDTLADLPNPDNPDENASHEDNVPWATHMDPFSRRQWDFAMRAAFVVPAIKELNEDIRISDYSIFAAGADTPGNEQQWAYAIKPSRPTKNVTVQTLDFNCEELYPVDGDDFDYHEFNRTALDSWATVLDFSGLGIDILYRNEEDDPANHTVANLEEDLDNIFVERAKHNLNAIYLAGGACSGKPTVPWLMVPGDSHKNLQTRFDVDLDDDGKSGDEEKTSEGGDGEHYTAKWPEIARIAVFAYRRGVREFVIWSADAVVQDDTNVAELENVLLRVEHAAARVSDVTTETSGDPNDRVAEDAFGVPDGQTTADDLEYYNARYSAGDPEADITDNTLDGCPDGDVDIWDWYAFTGHYYNGT